MDDLEQLAAANQQVSRATVRRVAPPAAIVAPTGPFVPIAVPVPIRSSPFAGGFFGTIGVVAALLVISSVTIVVTLLALLWLGILGTEAAAMAPRPKTPAPAAAVPRGNLFDALPPPSPPAPRADSFRSPAEAMDFEVERLDATRIHVTGRNLSARGIRLAQLSLFEPPGDRSLHAFRCDFIAGHARIDQVIEVRGLAAVDRGRLLAMRLTGGHFD